MNEPEITIPPEFQEGYRWLLAEMVKFFSIDKRSGKAEVNFKEGVPEELEPSPRIYRKRKK